MEFLQIEMDVFELFDLRRSTPRKVTIEATVPTGLESVGVAECKEKLGDNVEVCKARGRIFINVDISQIDVLFCMKSIDNVYVIAHAVGSVGAFQGGKEDDLGVVKKLAFCPDWKKAVSIWKNVSHFQGNCYPTRNEYSRALEGENKIKEAVMTTLKSQSNNEFNVVHEDFTCSASDFTDHIPEGSGANGISSCDIDAKSNTVNSNPKCEARKLYQEVDKRAASDKVLKYRVTCYRSGQHSFGSQDAAYHFGGELQDLFNWVVDLVHYDMEIVLNIKGEEVYIGIALTKESMHRRNIKQFGPTTLRATVCYCLLYLGEPKPGDIVIDPMCGGGSIAIEGALAFPGTFHISGDIHPKATARSWVNVQDLTSKRKNRIDLLSWDVKRLPLRDSSVDVFVTDLPFGKRSGSKQNNRTLYKDVLVELARVVRQTSGRAVLLTHDKKNLMRTLTQTHKLWTLAKIIGVNLGGLEAAVYVLKRTCNETLSLYQFFKRVSKNKKKLSK